MVKLTEPQKDFIVKELAMFDTPSDVVASFREEFGVTLERTQVAKYNPTQRAGRDVSKKLRAIFEATREAWLKECSEVGVMHKSYRLRSLDRLHRKMQANGNAGMQLQVLEQAAKESGGAFTNKQSIDHRHRGSIPVESLTDEELEADMKRLARDHPDLFRELLSGAGGDGAEG